MLWEIELYVVNLRTSWTGSVFSQLASLSLSLSHTGNWGSEMSVPVFCKDYQCVSKMMWAYTPLVRALISYSVQNSNVTWNVVHWWMIDFEPDTSYIL